MEKGDAMVDGVAGKLVRDGVPDRVRAAGGHRKFVVLSADSDFRRALVEKLHEEAEEVRRASPDTVVEELGDVLEVVRSLAALGGHAWDAVERAAALKRRERGALERRLWMADD
ncbi:MAG TPA: nucleoside triphosphate pyrophosphohydrolase [Kribbellaceae bacterium]|nr:nucleoside triphosphate pyrophosphohydrolase [Kribbellaceae bacterium]